MSKEYPTETPKPEQEQNHHSLAIDFSRQFAVSFCIGIRPDLAIALSRSDYRTYISLQLALYDQIRNTYQLQKIGTELACTSQYLTLMGTFPKEQEQDFSDRYLRPLIRQLEQTLSTRLCVGIGLPAYAPEQLKRAEKTAAYAFGLYFFDPHPVISLQTVRPSSTFTLDDYDTYVEQAFQAVLQKTPGALHQILQVIDVIASIHYGNWNAVQMRTMGYTGELASKFRRYQMLEQDFLEIQNELQGKIMYASSLTELKKEIQTYYVQLLPWIYQSSRPGSKEITRRIICYIQEHFMEELSISTLAQIGGVSPHYFSHMFKKETGINYKAYLTDLRLEKALHLLKDTDCKLYEICKKIGYKNVRTFTDAFKQRYHMSPMDYRKSNA